MADLKHKHDDNDIIIRDQDGSYKILRDGKFVALDEAAAAAHGIDAGPKRSPDYAAKAPEKPGAPAKTAAMTPAASRPAAPATSAPKPVTPPAKPAVTATRPQVSTAAASAKPAPLQKEEVRGFNDQGLTKQAEAIISKSGLTFASGELRSRVVNAVIAHLKGVRKAFETRSSLMKPVQEGGAGLTPQEADKILAAAGVTAAREVQEIKPETRPANPIVKPMRQPVGKEISAPARIALAAGEDVPYFPLTPAAPAGKSAAAAAPRMSIADVQMPVRPVSGPVNELGYDLVTWRRLAPNPMDRIKKIETQLDVLEQDGYPQRVKGIAAWRNSEVVSLYLAAGKRSLEEGRPLAELLSPGGDRLSLEEWQAVSALNARLTA